MQCIYNKKTNVILWYIVGNGKNCAASVDNHEVIYIVVGLCTIVIVLLIVSIVQMKWRRLKSSGWLEHPIGIPTDSVGALITMLVAISNKISIAENMPK